MSSELSSSNKVIAIWTENKIQHEGVVYLLFQEPIMSQAMFNFLVPEGSVDQEIINTPRTPFDVERGELTDKTVPPYSVYSSITVATR